MITGQRTSCFAIPFLMLELLPPLSLPSVISTTRVQSPVKHGKRTSFLLSLDEDLLDQQGIIDSEAVTAAEALGLGPIPQAIPNPTHHFFGSGTAYSTIYNGDQF